MTSVFCSRCGSPLTRDSRFCSRCGSEAPVKATTATAEGHVPARRRSSAVPIVLTLLGTIALMTSLALPWSWNYRPAESYREHAVDSPSALIAAGLAAVVAIAFVACRAATSRFRYASLTLLVPVFVLAIIAIPFPNRSDMREGGVLAIVAAAFFGVAMLADYLDQLDRSSDERGPRATPAYAPPPQGAPHPPAALRSPVPRAQEREHAARVPGPAAPTSLPSEARIVTRTTPPSGAVLVDEFERRGERVWSPEEVQRVHRLYSSGFGVEAIANQMRLDAKDIAAKLSRDLLGASGTTLVDPTRPRFMAHYEQREYDLMARWPEVSFAEIVEATERDQLGVGWRMLDRRIPRK